MQNCSKMHDKKLVMSSANNIESTLVLLLSLREKMGCMRGFVVFAQVPTLLKINVFTGTLLLSIFATNV